MRLEVARFVAGVAQPDAYPAPWGPEVAFVGRSNVGKSSLINAVVGRGRPARVSRTPGRTRQVNFFALGSGCALVDLPGYGYARVSSTLRQSWRPLVETYLTSGRPLALTLLLVDARRPPAAADIELSSFLRTERLPFRVVLAKAEALPTARRPAALDVAAQVLGLAARDEAPILTSARTGLGVAELRRLIRRLAAR